ncbi:uncharacterized protein [Littorina saxatilis]|uniref:uncharacterized protein isoform X2 n=1 Tax=Littorina saxatilis TaxID=31220 RepID=UPI0038B42007
MTESRFSEPSYSLWPSEKVPAVARRSKSVGARGSLPRETKLMASVVLGFAFDDGSFFNSSVPVGTWHHLQNQLDGNFYSLQFASQEASRRGITLTSQNLVQIAEGGMALTSGQPVQERVLYQTETQAVPLQCPPQAVDPPPHHSFEAVPGPSYHVEGGLQVLDEAMPISWTQPAVLLLIEEVRSHQHLFSSNAFKKNQVWTKVSTAVNRRGYSYSGFACDKKWRSLNTRFRTIKDKNSKTGQSRTSWAYYDLMEDVNAGNPAVNPPVRISSGGGITVTRSPSEGRSLSASPETTQPAEGLPRVPAMQVTRSPSEGRSLSVSPETTQPA